MPKQPVVTAKEMIAALERAGFIIDRQSGSHVVLIHKERKRASEAPLHGNRDLTKGALHRILKQADISIDELYQLLK